MGETLTLNFLLDCTCFLALNFVSLGQSIGTVLFQFEYTTPPPRLSFLSGLDLYSPRVVGVFKVGQDA